MAQQSLRMKTTLALWNNTCCLCGQPIVDMDAATFEHMIPRKFGGAKGLVGPAHYRCNQFRRHNSLLETARALSEFRDKIGEEVFGLWVHWPDAARGLKRWKGLPKRVRRIATRCSIPEVNEFKL